MYKRFCQDQRTITRSLGIKRIKPKILKMKMIVAVALALVAVAAAAPAEVAVPKILESKHEQDPEGVFFYQYKTENGIDASANSELKTVNDEDNKPKTVLIIRGTYSYIDESGKPNVVSYYADESGYHAEGESIPKNTRR